MPYNSALVKKIEEEIALNLTNEQFGVEDLAGKLGLSRSHLHRLLKKSTGKSISIFIREYRLKRGLELLRTNNFNVSETAGQVGFGSSSYFTTCFTEFYGYPPREAKGEQSNNLEGIDTDEKPERKKTTRKYLWILGSLATVILVIGFFYKQSTTQMLSSPSNVDKSVAILPFKNLSNDIENKYFVEGIVDAINRYLSGVQDLRVIPRTSSDRYKDRDISIKEIASGLNASNLLEGSIQRFENTVRIEVQLIEVSTESQVWAASYDREFKDILKVQSEIAKNVASALQIELSPTEISSINRIFTANSRAFDLYMKGIFEYRTASREGNHLAIDYFRQAIALDSNYAQAHAGLANCYMIQAAMFNPELDALEAMNRARQPLERALNLDPELPEALTWNGFYLLYNDWNFEGAEKAYQKAIATDNPDALGVYIDFLNFTGKHNEALTLAKRLERTNPFDPLGRMIKALYYTGNYEEAEVYAKSRLKLFNNYLTHDSYGFLLLNTGKYQNAIEIFQETLDMENIRYPRILGWMGAAYALSGNHEKAKMILQELKTRSSQTSAGSPGFFIAVVYTALGQNDTALEWLKKAVNEHEMEVPWLKSEPQFFPLHNDPRFQTLLEQVGFPA